MGIGTVINIVIVGLCIWGIVAMSRARRWWLAVIFVVVLLYELYILIS
jgi:hypothetical protein